MWSALERAVPAENCLGNSPTFITSNSCEKGKEQRCWTLPAAPLACSWARGAERAPSTALWPHSKENFCHFPEG